MAALDYISHKTHMIFGRLMLAAIASTLAICIGTIFGAASPAEAGAVVDRHFVTDTQYAGYYIDVNTIEIIKTKGGDETILDLYRVEPKKNRMYMERLHFLTGKGKYYSTEQKEYQYDNRALLWQSGAKTLPKYYLDQSPEGECLAAAQEWKRTHIHKTTDGQWLD